MSTVKPSKINTLLNTQPKGTVLLSSWLVKNGYSFELQKLYRKSRWFDAIGRGALVRAGDDVDYLGGVYALQSQLGLSVHPAGKTALATQGKSQYLELSPKKAQLFGAARETLPLWFKQHNWGLGVDCKLSSFLPPKLGLIDHEHKSFMVKISSPARAVMECLYMVPQSQPLVEIYELMEGLNNLRPASVQQLLTCCRSIKVKRLFLYLAEKAGHDWLAHLKLDDVGLGTGKRAIVPNGVYVPKYQIMVPRELEASP
jgi:hypothetical protein